MLDRRELMQLAAAGTASTVAAGMGMTVALAPSSARAGTPLSSSKQWIEALGRSLSTEHDYSPRVEGKIPADLSGALYRNGPGLFERGGHRKAHVLDGDGMIRALDLRGGTARFRNRFVRTEKYLEEEADGSLKYSTWTTRSPGGALSNLGGGAIKSQAGVTVYSVGKDLVALDEVGSVYTLDPQSLETTGMLPIDPQNPPGALKAHTKFDPQTGEWLLMGQTVGRKFKFEFMSVSKRGQLRYHKIIESPANYYIHDFAISESYFVVVLNPAEFSPFGFLAGMRSFTDSLTWRPDQPNIVLLVPRDASTPARRYEAPAAFMWHALNAYEAGDEVVLEFVGYDEPDHFIGDNPLFKSVMIGEEGNSKYPGTARRYRMNTKSFDLTEDILSDAHHEFPMTSTDVVAQRHRFGYFAAGAPSHFFGLSQLVRMDMETGMRDTYDHGPNVYVGEPVHVPAAGRAGWILQEGQDGNTGNGFYAIFAADQISGGPVARILLDHHLPISFHGHWRADGHAAAG